MNALQEREARRHSNRVLEIARVGVPLGNLALSQKFVAIVDFTTVIAGNWDALNVRLALGDV